MSAKEKLNFLFHPVKDVEKNWDVNLVKELEEYLKEVFA